MSSPSNLYAEKIFSEHPTALWPLDDVANYISLISEEDRDLTSWNISGGTAEIITNVSEEPFINSYITQLTGNVPDGDFGQVEGISNTVTNFSSLDSDTGTFSIGTYVYSISQYISSVEIGYEYEDPETLGTVQVVKSKSTPIVGKWFFISEIFEFPEVNANFRIVLKINYKKIGAFPSEEDFRFLVNGLSIGQQSEEFQAQSLGINPIQLPEDIALESQQGVELKAYGLQELSGYYLVKNNRMLSKNSGMPMVYGASNITKIYPNENNPSLIIPGSGFLNKLGQYKEYTIEMWLRLISDAPEPTRIFGPINSEDGIYVNGQFILIKIGDNVGSYFVGEWFRPMLIQFEIINNAASLIINGEQVISLSFLTSELLLPEPTNEFGESQDWLGFYGNEDITPFEMDAIALYSYQVAEIVAKRRFVYGQGVEFPENINASYNGESVFIDYPFAKYANNYTYPDIGRWNQGIVENLSTANNNLSIPEYQLPSFASDERTEKELFEDLKLIQEEEKFISLKPNEKWEETNSHLLFQDLAFLAQPTKAFFGIFSLDSISSNEEVLFELVNDQTNNRISITVQNSEVTYKIKYNNEEEVLYSYGGYQENEKFFIGIDIETVSRFYGGNVAALLGSPNQLKLYVGGSKEFANTFSGKIFSVGFSTKRNLTKFKNAFRENGFSDNLVSEEDFNKMASYTLLPKIEFDRFVLDVGVEAYWEDYQPLTYFAKYVTDSRGDSYYDIDFIQINVNSPAPNKYIQIAGKDYFDTTRSPLRTFVTFQYLESGANASEGFFPQKVLPPKNGVIEAVGNWVNTKYEFVNNTIIYPPTGIDFNRLAIVVHFEFNVDGIINKPVRVKSLQLASQSYNESSPNNIGTRFGLSIFPYKKSGVYFDYTAKNPYTIYKGSSPYLYMTKTSGVELKGESQSLINRGLSMPINQNLSDDYKIVAIQLAMMYPEKEFKDGPVQIFEIQGRNDYIKFFAEPIDKTNKRARIYAINANTGKVQDGLMFYWNGILSKDPIVTAQEWGMLGISFANFLILDNYVGAFRLTGQLIVNAVSNYKSTDLQQAQEVARRIWEDVRSFGDIELPWQFWADSYLWQEVLIVTSPNFYGVSPSTIYKAYTGTNKFIINDDRPIVLKNYNYNFYKDVEWQTVTVTPV